MGKQNEEKESACYHYFNRSRNNNQKQTFAEVIAMYATNTNKIVFNDFQDAYNIITNLEKIIEKVKEVQAKKKDAHIQKLKEEEERLRKEIEELSKL